MSRTNLFASALVDVGTTTLTENNDKTYSTSLNSCVDLFFQVGAIRGQPEDRIRNLFAAAYAENPELACKIALWARDIRGGAGERRTFRYIIKYLEEFYPAMLLRFLHKIPEVGRWDDLFVVMNTNQTSYAVLEMYKDALNDNHGLAAKWAPREDKDPLFAARLRNFLKLTPKQYRKLLVGLTKVVEQQMCANQWGEINYEHVPSVASARYSKAFGKHDKERYGKYIESVRSGEKKINTNAVYPYDVVKAGVDDKTADTMWSKLPDYVPDGLSFIPVVDVSGSMTVRVGSVNLSALDISTSLGLYLAEHNKGPFKNITICFSQKPTVFLNKGADVRTRINALRNSPGTGYNTNLDAVMRLILMICINNNIPQEDIPQAIVVLSDMEFDGPSLGSKENIGVAERTINLFQNNGYKCPNIIWWNLASRHGHTPIRFDKEGMALISGFSPAIMSSVLSGDMNPVKIMMNSVDKERYSF